MASLLEQVQQHLGPDEIAQIAQRLGVEPATAQSAVDAALPHVVTGVSATAQQQTGAGGAGGLLDSLGSLAGGSGGGLGGMLGSILGEHQGTAQQQAQEAGGLPAGKAQQLLTILGPIVLGVLAKRMTGGGNATAPGAGGGMGGVLGGILGKLGT
jgi:phytoene/squalene synthetase